MATFQECVSLSKKNGLNSEEIAELLTTHLTLIKTLPELYESTDNFRKLPDTINKMTTEIKTSQGRLAYLKKQIDIAGRGTENPACWADNSGRVEYIYQIALTKDGIVIHDSKLPHRETEQKELRVDDIIYDAPLTIRDFRVATKSLFEWSESNECRFFVKVFDMTGSNEKSKYKTLLRVVGEHFYYFEPVNEDPSWLAYQQNISHES